MSNTKHVDEPLTMAQAIAVINNAFVRPTMRAVETTRITQGVTSKRSPRLVSIGACQLVGLNGKIELQGPADDVAYWMGLPDPDAPTPEVARLLQVMAEFAATD